MRFGSGRRRDPGRQHDTACGVEPLRKNSTGLKPLRFSALSVARKSYKPNIHLLGFFTPAISVNHGQLDQAGAISVTVMKTRPVAFAGAGYTVQNSVLVATWWLHEPQRERVCC